MLSIYIYIYVYAIESGKLKIRFWWKPMNGLSIINNEKVISIQFLLHQVMESI